MKNINQICDYVILRLKQEEDMPLSNIKLQKLLYYIQAWSLALKNEKSFDGDFQAWVHGPVNRQIYDRFNPTKYLFSEISLNDIQDKEIATKLNESEISHINKVLEVYAPYSGVELEEMSHKEEPWISARKGYAPNQRCEEIIDEKLLGDYFRERTTRKNKK
ncbi:Panacea domain-containing protein [Flavobacterium marginilacus]|uniref:Panacea domain-containing protein n=1 Tax=Flavobacterium marginilacus TaxID=3003256 RepID=UPI00248F28B4|nr:type II toxin-antitoxin system antitoxin SocA domain-containing protein [Flavobacterium marginilacus]